MNINYKIGIVIGLIALVIGCKQSGPDVSHIKLEVEPVLFYQDFFALNEANMESGVAKMKKKYGSYFNAYCQGIVKIGAPGDIEFEKNVMAFLDYEENRDVFDSCQKVIPHHDGLSEQMTEAYKHYKYYFPKKEIPQVYFHTSYFNQSIVLDSSWISVSVEKYLGADCIFYEWLAVPKYLRRKMVPEKIVPDMMKAMAMGNFSMQMKNDDVISKMLTQGKIIYFVRQMMPELPDSLLFDYSEAEMDWCYKYEGDIWASMVEHKHLYNTERMIIQKYVGDSPFSYYFGQNSPGKAAIFLAYRIIESYIGQYPEITLSELMNETDAHKLFREARYRP